MSLLLNWGTVAEAESKYGINSELILKWVEEGIVRCEEHHGKVVRVNMDDLELKLRERVKP